MAAKKKKEPPRRGKSNAALKNGVAALVGGAGGALVGGLLVKAGVKPTTAAVGVTVAGGVGAFTLTGAARAASTGVAAAGAGQLALGWLAKVRQGLPAGEQLPQQLPAAHEHIDIDVNDAFRQARNQFDADDDFDDDDVEIHVEAA